MKYWRHAREVIGRDPVAEGRIGGGSPVYAEYYVFRARQLQVRGLAGPCLLTQLDGAAVRAEAGTTAVRGIPLGSLLVLPECATTWHYGGTIEFAAFYPIPAKGELAKRLVKAAAEAADAGIVSFKDLLVSACAAAIVGELRKGDDAETSYLAATADLMMIQACRVIADPTMRGEGVHADGKQPGIRLTCDYIRKNPAGDLSVASLAGMAGYSPSRFRGLFSAQTDLSPRQFILAVRLETARNLLASTSMPISAIALECGFASQSHLTASFRTAHRMTPAAYRRAFG